MTDRPLGRGLGALIPKPQLTPKPEVPPQPPRITIAPPLPARPLAPSAAIKLPDSPTSQQQVFDIPVSLVDPNPQQPRRSVDNDQLEGLIQSVRQHGIIQPLIVTKQGNRYQLIAGERRFRAAERLGLSTVPALIRDTEEIEQLEIAIVENIQRQDLNPIEEALAYQQLNDEYGLTQDQVALKVGKSRTTIANAMRLLSLPAPMLAALRDGRISVSHGKILLSAITPAERQQLFEQILEHQLPVRAAGTLSRTTTVRRHARRPADPVVQAVEDELRDQFRTKVTVRKREHRGAVSIEFYSDEEYDKLINRLRRPYADI